MLPLNSLEEMQMTTLSVVVLVLSIAYHWWIAFVMETKTLWSTFLFKMLPFLLGVGLIGVILYELGMIVMPTGGG